LLYRRGAVKALAQPRCSCSGSLQAPRDITGRRRLHRARASVSSQFGGPQGDGFLERVEQGDRVEVQRGVLDVEVDVSGGRAGRKRRAIRHQCAAVRSVAPGRVPPLPDDQRHADRVRQRAARPDDRDVVSTGWRSGPAVRVLVRVDRLDLECLVA
jgi:hypothetical protein